jgi:6-phosphogluconolactonase
MSPIQTSAGTVHVLDREAAFTELAKRINALQGSRPTVALSGGSTPKAFYAWAVATGVLRPQTLARVEWHVSDERCLPLVSEESNFGNAARGMLDPLGVADSLRKPWSVERAPQEAADVYEKSWRTPARPKLYDICVLGLGDDSHIASLWPECPLIADDQGRFFAATEWPSRGWRLTITSTGLAQCGEVIVLVAGAGKAAALKAVCSDPLDAQRHPGQVLRKIANRVTWIADADSARLL